MTAGEGLASPNSSEVHEIFRRGDLEALRSVIEGASNDEQMAPADEDPVQFPNGQAPFMDCSVLEYAIYHGPLEFVKALLEIGADPNYADHAGFPSIIAALSTGRSDRKEIVDLLIAAGAEVQQRGVNDYTPLHYAAAGNDVRAIELLVARGADPETRTRIDDCTTPLEEAENLGSLQAAEALRTLRADHRTTR